MQNIFIHPAEPSDAARELYLYATNCASAWLMAEAAFRNYERKRAKGLCYVIERDANGLWWILYGNARVHFEPVDGSFPNWTRIIPTAPETLTAAHYQPQYVAAMGDMSKALRDGKKDAAAFFRIHQNGENPALVTFDRACESVTDKPGPRTDCCAVLMPMRSRSDLASASWPADFLNT